MELKTKYQYTYFIHPYIVKENKYSKYLLRLLKDKKCSLRFFQPDRDYGIYSYFLPNIKEYIFKSFGFDKKKINEFNRLDKDMQAAILSKFPCTVFEYKLSDDIQGKTGEENGIFFKIQKIEIICFNTGICFLNIKTNLEETEEFSDVLNFNYKFRDIKSDDKHLKEYENIKIQTNSLSNMEKFSEIIKQITGENKRAKSLDLDTERFLTYSYVCIDQKDWDSTKEFSNVENDFIKFTKVLPQNTVVNSNNKEARKELKVIDTETYVRYGFTKIGTALFTTGADFTNYTKLPEKYENQYLYTYILALYSQIYLKKISKEFDLKKDVTKARNEFIKFNKELWVYDITNDLIGNTMYQKWKEVLEINSLYKKVKIKYDLMYKDLKIETNAKTIKVVLGLLATTVAVNIANFVALLLGK